MLIRGNMFGFQEKKVDCSPQRMIERTTPCIIMRRRKKRSDELSSRKKRIHSSTALFIVSLLGLGLSLCWSSGVVWCSGLETVLEPSGDTLEVSCPAGTGGLSSLGLLGPVVCLKLHVSALFCSRWNYLRKSCRTLSDFSGWVSATVIPSC